MPEGAMSILLHGQGVWGAEVGAVLGGRGCAGDSRAAARPPGAGAAPEGWAPAPGQHLSGAPILPSSGAWHPPGAAAQHRLLRASAYVSTEIIR